MDSSKVKVSKLKSPAAASAHLFDTKLIKCLVQVSGLTLSTCKIHRDSRQQDLQRKKKILKCTTPACCCWQTATGQQNQTASVVHDIKPPNPLSWAINNSSGAGAGQANLFVNVKGLLRKFAVRCSREPRTPQNIRSRPAMRSKNKQALISILEFQALCAETADGDPADFFASQRKISWAKKRRTNIGEEPGLAEKQRRRTEWQMLWPRRLSPAAGGDVLFPQGFKREPAGPGGGAACVGHEQDSCDGQGYSSDAGDDGKLWRIRV